MSNEIMKQQSLPSSLTEAIQMGKVFFDSGLFSDLKSAQQIVVKIQAGAELGIPPFQAVSGVHIIQGKPSIGAGLMAAKVKGSGKYNYKVVQQDEKACVLDFYEGKEKIGTSTFTLDDAKKAGTKNVDKFPRNMLFARAISNGVKWFCPDVFAGPVYVPEDFDVETVDVAHEEIKDAPPAPKKSTITDKGFNTLLAKVAACNTSEELSDLHNKTVELMDLTDQQADVFAAAMKTKSEGVL